MGTVPTELTVPPLGQAYVSPGFRVTATLFDGAERYTRPAGTTTGPAPRADHQTH